MPRTERLTSHHLLTYPTDGGCTRARPQEPRGAGRWVAPRLSVDSDRKLVLRMDDPENRWRQAQTPEQEQESLAELYKRYAPGVARFFANRRFSPEDVQDLTQETFLSAFRERGALRDKDKFEAWLYKIAVNKWRNACRDRATARRYVQEGAVIEELDAGKEPIENRRRTDSPLQNALLEEEHRLLQEALAELSPPLRNAVLLRLDQGLSYEEIATVLHIPIGTVKSRLNSAAGHLRRFLGEAYRVVGL
jgi:RNA polymerase sigma-70 factor, ECF subfamily